MENQNPMSFTFEIDNFLEKEAVVPSPKFLTGRCEWIVDVYPKGRNVEDHLSLFLCVANPESLRLGWKRRATYSFILLNQSGKEIYRMHESCRYFCSKFSIWGVPRAFPLKELKEQGFLENNKLIVKVEIKVHEVVDEEGVTGKEMLDLNGFLVLYSQVVRVSRLFEKHPDIAVNFKQTRQFVKTSYMNLLLGLIKTLKKPPHSFTETELVNARSELIELKEVGFKLDWLETKLDDVSVEWKKANTDVSRVQEIEEHTKEMVGHALPKDWFSGVVRCWNEWKVRMGFVDFLGEKKDY